MENKKKVIMNFQGVRGYAIVLIFLSHCKLGTNTYGISKTTWFGAYGVSIFIVLSGYLLMENHKNKPLKWGEYVKGKIVKFYPLHILTMFFSIPLNQMEFVNNKLIAWTGLAANFFLLQAWIPIKSIYFSYNAVSWYLSMMMFLVIVSPLILYFWEDNKLEQRNAVIRLIIGIILAEYIIYYLFYGTKVAHWIIYIFPLVRMIDYMMGTSIWVLKRSLRNQEKIENIKGMIGVIISVLLLCASMELRSEICSVVLWCVPSIMIVLFAASNTHLSRILFSNKFAVFMGNVSFELFLVHKLSIKYAALLFEKMGMKSDVILLLLSLSISVVISLLCKNTRRKYQGLRERLKNDDKI